MSDRTGKYLVEDTEPGVAEEGAETRRFVLPENAAGERLDRALTPLVGDLSRARLQRLIRAGLVTVDGEVCRARHLLAGGEQVVVTLPPAPVQNDTAEAMPIDVRLADADVIVVAKPAGLTVHPGAGNPSGTLMNALLHAYPELGALPRAGLVHRLDKDTSGLLVVARSERAHRRLVADLAARAVTREYLAVVRGVPTAGGTVDAPIGRHPRHRTRMAVVGGGREAVTDYRVERRFGHHAALAVRLRTGRTHQIRVHMAHIGHALVGDPAYGTRTRVTGGIPATLRDRLADFPRQALHARMLAFSHPATGDEVRVSLEPPDDLAGLLAALAADDPANG